MDTKTFAKDDVLEVAGKPSRLPAGSTLLVNGMHVPHPHAEVNLAGAGDPRLGDTKAVTEFTKTEGIGDDPVTTLVQEPLHDEVKPRRLTIATDTPKLNPIEGTAAGGVAKSADLELREDPADKTVELPK